MVDIRPCSFEEIEQSSYLADEYSGYALDGMPPVNVQWHQYRAMAEAGVIVALGAYLDDVLAGFVTLLVNNSLHYGVKTVITESFFVGSRYRSSGAGLNLLVAAQDYAKAVEAAGLIVAAPVGKELSEFLPKLGYVASHTIFFKGIAHE
jgi:predicted acetyltransferase